MLIILTLDEFNFMDRLNQDPRLWRSFWTNALVCISNYAWRCVIELNFFLRTFETTDEGSYFLTFSLTDNLSVVCALQSRAEPT